MDMAHNGVEEIINEYEKQSSEKKDFGISEALKWGLQAGVFVKNIWDIYKSKERIENIDELINQFKNFSNNSVSKIYGLIETINVKPIKAICTPLKISGDCVENTSEIIEKLQKSQEEIAKDVIRNSAIASFLLITIQVAKIISVWRDISNAKNVVQDSKTTFPAIKKKIDELKEGIAEIHQNMKEYEKLTSAEEKLELARDINDIIGSLNSTYAETILLISDIKLNLGNNITRIDLRKNEQIVDGFSNAVQGVTNLLQLLALGGSTSSGWKLAHGLTTTAYFGLAFNNIATYIITSDTLDNLRESMQVVIKFEKELNQIRKTIQEAEKWYKNIRQSRRKQVQ